MLASVSSLQQEKYTWGSKPKLLPNTYR